MDFKATEVFFEGRIFHHVVGHESGQRRETHALHDLVDGQHHHIDALPFEKYLGRSIGIERRIPGGREQIAVL